MVIQKNSFSTFWFVLMTLGVASAQHCLDTGFFRLNSTYDRNRRLILSSIASNVTAQGGFYNASVGQDAGRVYAMGMCTPEAKPEACSDCIRARSEKLIQNCPNQTEAFEWDGPAETLCLLRYSNRSFFGSLDLEPRQSRNNGADIDPNLIEFNKTWENLMAKMIATASSGRSSSKVKYYAADTADVPSSFDTIYALMQCTSDLSPGYCNNCLRQSVADYQACCRGKKGSVFRRPSCYFRWELYPFHGVSRNRTSSSPPQPESQPPTPSAPSGDQADTAKKDNNTISTGTIIAIVVPMVVIILVLLGLGFVVYRRRRKPYREIETESEADAPSSLNFDLSIVQAATNDFSGENRLGGGGFGPVYKGKLVNGQEVAVKRLSKHPGQGEQEFKTEVSLLSRLQHRNLVKLLGYCLKGGERLLIYEFLPNSSLDQLIFDSVKCSLASWNIRYNIIGGMARGLLYLHEDSRLRIIHRDLKPSNILLENEMNPKISDFGMARLFTAEETQANASRVMGTYGYMAPEYIAHGQFSVKSDVYSFGIMVLEIISGQKSSSFQPNGLPCYAWMKWREGQGQDIIDPIMRDGSISEIMRCIHIGLLCVQENVARRPTMNSIIVWLSSTSASLPVPKTPAFFMHNTSELETSSSLQSEPGANDMQKGKNSQVSVNEASMTELDPR